MKRRGARSGGWRSAGARHAERCRVSWDRAADLAQAMKSALAGDADAAGAGRVWLELHRHDTVGAVLLAQEATAVVSVALGLADVYNLMLSYWSISRPADGSVNRADYGKDIVEGVRVGLALCELLARLADHQSH